MPRGGEVLEQACAGFERDGARVTHVRAADSRLIPVDEVVIAAGAQSKGLARQLRVPLHLEGVIGYSTALQDPGVDLKHTVFYQAGGFGITSYDGALAVAGTVEFASLRAAPNWRRADVLVNRAPGAAGAAGGQARAVHGPPPVHP